MRTRFFRVADKLDRIPVELRVERKPAHAHRIKLEIHEMLAREAAAWRVKVGVGLLVSPLIAVDVVERGAILQTRRTNPIERHRDGAPGRHGSEFFLARVVIEAAAVHTHATAQNQS